MAAQSLGQAVARNLGAKALIWGPCIAGTILLGPVGALLGAGLTIALVASGGDNAPQDKSLER
jgi:hypothetical protein